MHFEVASAEAPTVAQSDTGPPVLDVRQLSAWYGHRQAIDSIALQISARRITAIIGPRWLTNCRASDLITSEIRT